MAYFAQVNGNEVLRVIAVDDADSGGGTFPESEPVGQEFIKAIGIGGDWLQTSLEGSFRGTYAGQGFTYDPDLDEFVAPTTEEE